MKDLLIDIVLPVALMVVIVVLGVFIALQCAPDKIIYQFAFGDEVVTFDVTSLDEHTDAYYRFTLPDGSQVTYYVKPGTVVIRTEIRN